MYFFKIINNKLNHIKENPFNYEKEIQILTEENLEIIFGFEFVKSEFTIKDFRIDTLAFDNNKKTFIIIEYKRDKNFSVVDQGYTYKNLMLNYKAEFILEYNENSSNTLKRNEINWEHSKILFISPSFTKFQKGAIKNKDLPIELWEIKRFQDNIVRYNSIQKLNRKTNIKIPVTNNSILNEQISTTYTEQFHFNRFNNDIIINLYKKLKDKILLLDNFEIKYNKWYISFILNSNIVDFNILKTSLRIFFNLKKGQLDDPKDVIRDVSNIGHSGNGDYDIKITSDEYFDYIIYLIKQCIEKQKG